MSAAEQIDDGLLAVADGLNKLAAALSTSRTPEPAAHEKVVSVLPSAGWRALIGHAAGGKIEYALIPVIAWATTVQNIRDRAAIAQCPVVFDSETARGITLEEFLFTTPGAVARILDPGQEGLTASAAEEFEAEILRRSKS